MSSNARIPFEQITGMLHDDPECWDEVDAWIDAARVTHVMSGRSHLRPCAVAL